jgi:hypothetical protein
MDSVISYKYRVGIYQDCNGNAGKPIATRTYRRNEKNESDYVRELAYAEFGEDVLCRVDSVGMVIEDDTQVIGG